MPQTEASLPNSLGLGFRVYRLAFGPEQVMRGHVTLEDPRQQGSTLTYRQRLCCRDPTGFRVQVFRSVCKFSYNDHEDSESDDACHYSWLRDPSLSTNLSVFQLSPKFEPNRFKNFWVELKGLPGPYRTCLFMDS